MEVAMYTTVGRFSIDRLQGGNSWQEQINSVKLFKQN